MILDILNYSVFSIIITYMFVDVMFELKMEINNRYLSFLISKTYCTKCFGFWFSLIMCGDIFFSAYVSLTCILFEFINKKINIIE